MGRHGSQVITCRLSGDTIKQLEAFCATRGLSRSSAIRLILETTLGAANGRSPREAAILAAVDEAVWRLASDTREVVAQVVNEAAESISERLLRKFHEG